jgi:hypothetical protein
MISNRTQRWYVEMQVRAHCGLRGSPILVCWSHSSAQVERVVTQSARALAGQAAMIKSAAKLASEVVVIGMGLVGPGSPNADVIPTSAACHWL